MMDINDFRWESQGCYAEPFSAQRVVEAEQCEKAYGKRSWKPYKCHPRIHTIPALRQDQGRSSEKERKKGKKRRTIQCSVK